MAYSASVTGYVSGNALVVSSVLSGSLSVGQLVYGSRIPAGTTIATDSGNGINYTISNSITPDSVPWNTTIAGNATNSVLFNGTSQYIITASAPAIGTNNFTAELWVYHNSSGLVEQYFDSPTNGFSLSKLANNTIQLAQAGVATVATSTGTVPINQWVHIAVVRTGTGAGGVVFYINGVASGTGTSATNFAQSAFSLGRQYGAATSFLNGFISNLRFILNQAIFTGAFTPAQLPLTNNTLVHSGSGIAASLTGTVSLLTFQSAVGIRDNSSSPISFTIFDNPFVFNGLANFSFGTFTSSGTKNSRVDSYLNSRSSITYKPTIELIKPVTANGRLVIRNKSQITNANFISTSKSITFKPIVELIKPVTNNGKLAIINKSQTTNANFISTSKNTRFKPALFPKDKTVFTGRGIATGIKRVSNSVIITKTDSFRSNVLSKPITNTSRLSTPLKYLSSNTVNYIYTSSKSIIFKPSLFREDATNYKGRGRTLGIKRTSNTILLSRSLVAKTFIPTTRPFVKSSNLLGVRKFLSSNTYNLVFTSSKSITFRVVPVMTMALTGGSNTLPTGAGTSIQQLWYTD